MNDPFDQLVAATRERLRGEARQVADADLMLRDIVEGTPLVPRSVDDPARNRRTGLLAATATIVLIVGGGLVLLRRDDDHVGNPQPSQVSPPAPTALLDTVAPEVPATTAPPVTATPTTASPSTTVVTSTSAARVSTAGWVIDMSFIDNMRGWALLGDDTAAASILIVTSDGGQSWKQTGVDTHDATHVKFADAANGWMYGDDGSFESTHDGGGTWRVVDLAPAGLVYGPVALTADSRTVSIVAGVSAGDQNANWTVAQSPVASDDFARVGIDLHQGAGPANYFSMASSGGNTWAIYNDRVVTGAGRRVNGVASTWTGPWAELGGPATVAVAGDGGPVYVAVTAGVWTGPVVENRLYVSDDGGETFRQVALPAGVVEVPPGQVLAASASTVIVTVASSDGSAQLYGSDDEGTTWDLLSTFPQVPSLLVFVDATTAFAALPSADGSYSQVLKSTDGGATWPPVEIVAPT